MKYVKLFEGFKEDEIHAICRDYDIENYTINPDGSIDSENHVDLSYFKIKKLPIKFNKVMGGFECNNNKLTTLEGSPNYVGRDFHCRNNNILTFEGAPNYIRGVFYCLYNPVYIIWKLFRDYSKVELLNDYDALRIENGQGICILSRLNGFLEDIGRPKVTKEQIEEIEKQYEIR